MLSWLPLDLWMISAFAVGCALFGLVGLLAGFLVKRSRRWRLELGLFAVVGLLGVGGLVLGAEAHLWAPCFAILLAGAVLALFRVAFLARLGLLAQTVLSRPAVVWLGLFVLGLGTLVGQMLHLESQVAADEFPADALEGHTSPEEVLTAVESQWAVTDAGRPIPLFTIPSEATILPAKGDAPYFSRNALDLAMIRTDKADTLYNCHGFVFTGGRYWVRGSYVEQILIDNGYQPTTQPRPGDVVVYRDNHNGQVAHTGLVRAVVEDTGTILIESKMGAMGRFIHTPDKHPYRNTTLTYYRTGRAAHVLRGLDGRRGPERNPLTTVATH